MEVKASEEKPDVLTRMFSAFLVHAKVVGYFVGDKPMTTGAERPSRLKRNV